MRLIEVLGGICVCGIDPDDPHIINVRYPAAFPDTYLRPEMRLEIGPQASWVPHEERTISCYAAQVFPDLFENHERSARVIKAERTFWEKATILHHEFHRPEGSTQPRRYSRHYYDLAMMAASPVKDIALPDVGLLESVVLFKQQFCPRGWARYDLAKHGTMRLVPRGHVLETVETDYAAMVNMVFGDIPEFDAILKSLKEVEDEING